MNANDMSIGQLGDALMAYAAGIHAEEAAVELLIAHGTWIARNEFRGQYVGVSDDGHSAWIDWEKVSRTDREGGWAASPSAIQILHVAMQLAHRVDDWPLSELITGLDTTNVRLVLDAIAHAAGWRERHVSHTVTGNIGGDR